MRRRCRSAFPPLPIPSAMPIRASHHHCHAPERARDVAGAPCARPLAGFASRARDRNPGHDDRRGPPARHVAGQDRRQGSFRQRARECARAGACRSGGAFHEGLARRACRRLRHRRCHRARGPARCLRLAALWQRGCAAGRCGGGHVEPAPPEPAPRAFSAPGRAPAARQRAHPAAAVWTRGITPPSSSRAPG